MTANVSTIQLKRTVIGTVPSSLQPGELMVDQNKALLYWADGSRVIHNMSINPEGGGGPILALGNFATSGAIGTAAATVDIYGTIRVSQTTTGISLTLPTPTLTGSTIQLRVVNTGTVAFSMTYNIPPGYQLRFVWDPTVSAWKTAVDVSYTEQRTLVYSSGIFVNPNDFVSYNSILYKYTGTAGIITTAPVTGTLWYPTSPVTAVWFANAAQSIANSAATPLNFQYQYQAGDGCYSTTSTAGLVVTLPVTGIYNIKATVEWPGTSAVGIRNTALIVNGIPIFQTQITQTANETTSLSDFFYNGTAGDLVYIALNQTSGGSLISIYNVGPNGYYQCNRLSITLLP